MTSFSRSGARACLLAALAAATVAASPTFASSAKPATVPAPIPGDADASLGVNDTSPNMQELTAGMRQMHLTICAARVQKVVSFLLEDQAGAHFTFEPFGMDSDRAPAVFVVATPSPAGGHTRLSTFMITPTCAGMYEQVVYWSQPCASVRTSVFGKFTGDRVLSGDIHASQNGPALAVYLMPAGAGCISVKKEMFQ